MSSFLPSITELTPLTEVLLLKNRRFVDSRGYMIELFNAKIFKRLTGLDCVFVQDNFSRSKRGVLRGIHYQVNPHSQGKLVQVLNGAIYDVVVDLRRSSKTFARWVGNTLTAANNEMLWIPPGFGHGFVTLEDNTDLLYKTTDFYTPGSEASVAWNDPTIGIEWPREILGSLQLSAKDQTAPRLEMARVFE